MGDIIDVINNKGGVGKTLVTQLLMAQMAMEGYKVAGVDLDPQANLTRRMRIPALEMATRASMAEVFRDIDSNPALIKSIVLPCQWKEDYADRIDIYPSKVELAGQAEAGNGSWLRLQESLEQIRDDYDFIFVDTPPGLGGLAQNGLVAADHVVLVTWPETDSINGVHRVIAFMKAKREGLAIGVTADVIGVIVNHNEPRTLAHQGRVKEIQTLWGDLVWEPSIPKTTRLQMAASEYSEPPQNAGDDVVKMAKTLGQRFLKEVGR